MCTSSATVRRSLSSIVQQARQSCGRTTVLQQAGFPGFRRRSHRDERIYARHGVGFMAYLKEDIAVANKRATARLARTPTATAARYDRRSGRVVIDLSTGVSIMFRPQQAQGLEHAKPEQLTQIEISPSGLGLHFPALDADIYLPSLLQGFLGSRRWMAAQLGKAGGRAKSAAKTAAARANGKLGGRPKKAHV